MSPRPAPPPRPGARSAAGHRPQAPARRAPDARRWLREPALRWIGGAALLALALRLWHIRHGLPDFLDEAIPLRGAIGMVQASTGAIDWNPHRFHYPSLTFYLHLFLQRLVFGIGSLSGAFQSFPDYVLHTWADPSLLAIPGRCMSVAFDVWTVWSVGRIGWRWRKEAGVIAALLVACSNTMIRASRLVYTDTIMTAFALAALERLFAWRREGGATRLLTAIVLLGLAVGSKYPAALLLLPFAATIALRERARALPSVVMAGALTFLVFLATTPFALLDLHQFLADVSFVGRMSASGHFGNYERAGFLFHLGNIVRDFGWAAPALVLAAIPFALWSARAEPEPALIALAMLSLGLPIAFARIEAERYLIPILPLVALLVSWGAACLSELAPAAARRPAFAALCATVLLPAAWAGVSAGRSLEDATRIEARKWCEAHLGRDDLIVQEVYGAPLLERSRVEQIHAGRVYALGSPGARRTFDRRPAWRTVTLPLTVVGANAIAVAPPSGPPVSIEVVERPAQLNAPLYDPRLFAGVDVVVTSSAVRGRFEGDPKLYPEACAFYALLDSTAEPLARFVPRGADSGPELRVYRLTGRTRAAIAARGPLPPLWWLAAIEPSFRAKAEAVLLPAARRGTEPEMLADGTPAAWVRALDGVFGDRYEDCLLRLARELYTLDRPAALAPIAGALRAMSFADPTMRQLLPPASERGSRGP